MWNPAHFWPAQNQGHWIESHSSEVRNIWKWWGAPAAVPPSPQSHSSHGAFLSARLFTSNRHQHKTNHLRRTRLNTGTRAIFRYNNTYIWSRNYKKRARKRINITLKKEKNNWNCLLYSYIRYKWNIILQARACELCNHTTKRIVRASPWKMPFPHLLSLKSIN